MVEIWGNCWGGLVGICRGSLGRSLEGVLEIRSRVVMVVMVVFGVGDDVGVGQVGDSCSMFWYILPSQHTDTTTLTTTKPLLTQTYPIIIIQYQMNIQECQSLQQSNTTPQNHNQLPSNTQLTQQPNLCTKLVWASAGLMIVVVTVVCLEWIVGVRVHYFMEDQLINDTDSIAGMQEIEQMYQYKPGNTKKYRTSPQSQFAYKLHTNIHNTTYILKQQQQYQQKYNISQYNTNQLPLCIVSTGRNTAFQFRYRKYLYSIARQRYDNYRVVIVDDFSDDGTVGGIRGQLGREEFDGLRGRFTIVQNKQRKYALFNKDLAITSYCHDSDIIVELDSDDQLIGAYVFSAINAIYSANSSIWAMYSSYIYWNPDCGCPTEGISAPVPSKILEQGTYRSTTQFYTSATKTYRKQLYNKLDKRDFVDKQGNFYKWTSDLFVHYSLVELAGLEHYKFVHQIFYYYHLDHNTYNRVEKAISRLNSLTIQPYKKLKALSDKAERDNQVLNLNWIEAKKREFQQCLIQHTQSTCNLII